MSTQPIDTALQLIDGELSKLQVKGDILLKQNDDGSIIACQKFDRSDYTCGICMEEICGEITCCGNHHPLCSKCWRKMDGIRCPTCRTEEGRYTNNCLMQALKKILKPCLNDARCSFKGSPKQLAEHSSDCQYEKINCPFCYGQTTIVDIVAHTETECVAKFRQASDIPDLLGLDSDECQHKYMTPTNNRIFVQKSNTLLIITCIRVVSDDDAVIRLRYNIEHQAYAIILPINKKQGLSVGYCAQIKILNTKIAQWSNIRMTIV